MWKRNMRRMKANDDETKCLLYGNKIPYNNLYIYKMPSLSPDQCPSVWRQTLDYFHTGFWKWFHVLFFVLLVILFIVLYRNKKCV